jgi:hypothetical protein
VESTLGTGKALANYLGVLVNQNAHEFTPYAFCAALTTC